MGVSSTHRYKVMIELSATDTSEYSLEQHIRWLLENNSYKTWQSGREYADVKTIEVTET